MSSYFDRMGVIYQDKTGRWLVKYVFEQMRIYLEYLGDNVSEEEGEKLAPLWTNYHKIMEGFEDGKVSPEWALSNLHELAHDIARARIQLQDGRYASDNPTLY